MNPLDLDHRDDRVLGRILRRQAAEIGDDPFLVDEDAEGALRTLTYADVDRLADERAGGLAALGVGDGDTAALLVDSCVDLVPLTFGINRLGAIWVPTNTDYRGQWLQDGLEGSRARVLVVDDHLVPRVTELDGLGFDHVVVRHGPESRGHDPEAVATGGLAGVGVHALDDLRGDPPHPVDAHYGDTVAVLWTSGTTGRSKGVMQSHNAWIRAALSGAATARMQDGDVLYCCLPMYNSAAWVGVIYRALVYGLPAAIDRGFSVERFWDRVRRFDATQIFTLGAMHMYLLQAPPRPDDADNPARVASAIPMPDRFIGPFTERFGIETIQQGYGQSEIMGLISRVDDGTTDWGENAAGKPVEGIEVRLLDDDDIEVAVGEVGEFCVRPTEPHVLFNGYFGDPETTLASVRNLWYHTGDLGRRDEDGQFYFVDRKRDYIRHKGRSVSSMAVEATASAHPSVAESAAVAVEAELESEAEILLMVVPAEGAEVDPATLARFVNDNAPHFFVPRYIATVDSLPQTPTGRVQKYKLRRDGVPEGAWDREVAGFEVTR